MLVKTRGIFLNYVKYSDSSIIAHIYTEAFGQQSYIVSGIHGKRSKTKINLFQSLFLLDLEVWHKPNNLGLQRLKNAHLAAPLSSLPFDIQKSSQALFIAELLNKVLREEEPSNILFDFLFSSVMIFDTLEGSVSNFLIVFLFKLTWYLGILPKEKENEKELFFDLMLATFVRKEPVHPHYLSVEDSLRFANLFQSDYARMYSLGFTNHHRRTIFNALILYYKIHLEMETEFKSLTIMREIMQG